MSARLAPALSRRFSPGEADRLYRPPCWQAPAPTQTLPGDPTAGFVPDPGQSFEQAIRYRHGDLASLSAAQLWRELRQAEHLLAWLPGDDQRLPWIAERRRALAGEDHRRRLAR